MAFIGNTPTTQGFIPAVDFFNGNASTTAFTLSRPVASVAQVQAVVENVPQKPGDAYTISGNTITFTSAPPSGTNNIYIYYTSPITQVIAPSQGTVGTAALATGLDVSAGNVSYTGTLTGGTGVVNLGSGQVYKDSSGNVGIGVTPSAWSGAQVVQLGARGGLMYRVDLTSTEISTNSYYNSSVGYVYQASAAATLYRQSSGAHSWFNASSGTAGNVVGYTQVMGLDTSGNLQFNSGYGSAAVAYGCRAWVNFNGTGTVEIRASGNVTSITDNGTGLYTVNFTNAMPDANYATTIGVGERTNDQRVACPLNETTTSVQIGTRYQLNLGSRDDSSDVSVSIFR